MKIKKILGTDHLIQTDLYLVFSMICLICTWVLLIGGFKSLLKDFHGFRMKTKVQNMKIKKIQGTDHLKQTDLYIVFSMISMICTWVLHMDACFGAVLGQATLAKPRYRSNWRSKAEIKEISENPRYRSRPWYVN